MNSRDSVERELSLERRVSEAVARLNVLLNAIDPEPLDEDEYLRALADVDNASAELRFFIENDCC